MDSVPSTRRRVCPPDGFLPGARNRCTEIIRELWKNWHPRTYHFTIAFHTHRAWPKRTRFRLGSRHKRLFFFFYPLNRSSIFIRIFLVLYIERSGCNSVSISIICKSMKLYGAPAHAKSREVSSDEVFIFFPFSLSFSPILSPSLSLSLYLF